MDFIMYYICYPLGYLMKWCWELFGNYGVAVIFFTLATKIVILPLSVWVHKNSIKMVKIQPDINFMKAKYYGDTERIAEEQTKLYKKAKYNPLASIVPLVVQIVLLMAVVYIIKEPLTYILHIDSDVCKDFFTSAVGVDWKEGQLDIIRAVNNGSIQGVASGEVAEAIKSISSLKLGFLGFDLGVMPSKAGWLYVLVPLIAGISALILCWAQNVMNVLQAEQSKLNKYGMTVLSVGISLGLGFFVYSGVALYWVFSNLFAILQLVLLNMAINPKKQVDYEALEKSRQALADIEALDSGSKKDVNAKLYAKREKADYKKFFHVVNKHLVIYSEKSGFYKYYEALVTELLKRSNMTIHYVTNDPNDIIFKIAESEQRIRPYYVGQRKLITLMMKLEADIVVMTTPDLDKYYIKRSLIDKNVEYIYLPHDMMSVHMGFREGALDRFDTIFCTGPHVEAEVRATERVYKLPEKTLVHFGYPLEEKLIKSYEDEKTKLVANPLKEILIAPSWQEDNLLDSCIDKLIEQLVRPGYHVTVRPHPEYVKRYPEKMNAIVERFKSISCEKLSFELDFSSNRSTYASDLLVTDWSAIAYEFAFATKKPALFVNTQIKLLNHNWQNLELTPVEISLRDKVGISLEKSELDKASSAVDSLLADPAEYSAKITDILGKHLYNLGDNGKEGAMYILNKISMKQKAKKD